MAHRGMAFRVCFSTRRAGRKIIWKYSSRLLTGKIVALTPANDLFSSKYVVAVVAARPLEGVSKAPPEVDLFFAHPEDMDFDPLKQWVMIEACSGYYEAHRHTMTALQKLSSERFPLSNHICGLDTQIDVPEYITSKPKMDFRAFAPVAIDSRQELLFDVIEQLESAPLKHLNRYQQDAMRHMLANKVAIRKCAVEILLSSSPHIPTALDQLLTHVADFEPNYIRLGGRSNNLRVAARTLFSMKENKPMPNLQNALLSKARQNHTALVTDIIQNTLEGFYRQSADRSGMAFVLHGLLTEEQLNNLEVGSNQWMSYNNAESSPDPFTAWLGRQAQEFKDLYSEEQYSAKIYDCDQDYEMLMEIEAEQAPDADEWESLKGRFVEFHDAFPFFVRGTRTLPPQTMERYLSFRDLWEIPYDHRGAVYKELHNRLVRIVRAGLQKKLKIYMLVSKTLQIGKFEYDYEILKTAKVIRMTTTGLSKYRGLVSALKPRIVIIEEAAEVFEAPVAVACFESLQHLILVGDHKQLKGHCAVHDLAGEPYFLDVSMFQRLVQNDFPFVMLKEQRRRAPEIRRLLAPIYDDLRDHSSVSKHEPVPGMGDVRSFFVTHNWPEVDDSLTSKVNEIEALLVYELYCYLCANGVPSQKITILTFYNGQRKKIRKMLMDNEITKFQDPTVVTVDSYQGEENDIVILSLVRSKEIPATSIGFLAVDNGVCVALSRARRGLYIFGKARHLVAASELWRPILTIMKAGSGGNPPIGYGIPVTCQHGTITIMRNIGD
ncbi:Helicase required for RNAi-mediated heterochromatin assembly 1 [Penicillium subrubescens]|uniref:Helicase required for RNAi-mediated heterochromatin assembly 1 n=1 Tax=Penicillium subrubescens TaxID=1316194 RepID=A0A1Q5TI07_9EURO|nr:Helicase required for RNAi-mediated heterochromatin assembly 1 [Penicillium subrubescens]